MGRGLDIIMPSPHATSLKIPQMLKDANEGVSGQERGTQPEEGEGGGGTGNMLKTALVGDAQVPSDIPKPCVSKRRLDLYHWVWVTRALSRMQCLHA